MRRAGQCAARHVRQACGAADRVLVLAGPGDNGGDGAICATELARLGLRVQVASMDSAADGPPPRGADAADRAAAWQALDDAVGRVRDPHEAAAPQVIVDAIFGIGLSRPVGPPYDRWIEWANAQRAHRIALDVPSGLSVETGALLGTAPSGRGCAFQAHETITFVADKPGLHTGDGPDYAGRVHVETLWADAPYPIDADGILNGPDCFAGTLERLARRASAHKGLFGTVALAGGAAGMAGALLLAARAALKTGAGRVRAGFLGASPLPVDPVHPELMLSEARSALEQAPTVVAVGPGLGRSRAAASTLRRALQLNVPLVLDADALNLLADDAALGSLCATRTAATVITPHPLEAARLLRATTADIQRDRVSSALALARTFGAIALLKGSGTVVADPSERWWINPTGGPALASGGTGDVLTGIVASLLAQTVPRAAPPEQSQASVQAVLAAVWLHGAAGDAAADAAGGPCGVAAGEIIDFARARLNALIAGRA